MGAYTLLQDLTVATNSTSVVLNNFGTITKDDFVKIVITNINNSSGGQYFLTGNASINTNYHSQLLRGAATDIVAIRANTATTAFIKTGNSLSQISIAYLKLSENDRMNVFSTYNHSITTASVDLENGFVYSTSSGATFANGITSLTLTSEAANNIGTGSRIQIYRLDAEKVADITVATTTDQVDISSLSIDKDSEYLLVSDHKYGSGSRLALYINDNTTGSNYHSQNIRGIDTTLSASRVNDANASTAHAVAAGQSLLYSYIKLSNIGAYTHQSYAMLNYGTTTPQLSNWFASSTAENITSITKLNIVAGFNQIVAGSRFILYKLYE